MTIDIAIIITRIIIGYCKIFKKYDPHNQRSIAF